MTDSRTIANSVELAKLDQAPYEGPRRYYVICSTPRTGSSLLCDLLTRVGVGVPMEYFHRRNHVPKFLSHYRLLGLNAANVTMQDYIDAIKRNRTTPNGYFGFKAHRGQFKWLIDNCDLGQCFPSLKYVYVFRADTIAQAVSESKAVQTRQWMGGQAKVGEPEYNEAHIDYCVRTIRKANRYWLGFFEGKSIEPLRIRYEDFVGDKERELRRLLKFLGVSDSRVGQAVQETPFRKQADSVNEYWIERYKARHDDRKVSG